MDNLLIAIHGNADFYKAVRDRLYRDVFGGLCDVKEYFGETIKVPFNESIGAVGREITRNPSYPKCFILCHGSVKPISNWIKDYVESEEYKNYSFICDSSGLDVCIINVAKVRLFDLYKRVGSPDDLFDWLKNKSISEGHKYRLMDVDELDGFGIISDDDVATSSSKRGRKKKDKEFEKEVEKEVEEIEEIEEIEETAEEGNKLDDGIEDY